VRRRVISVGSILVAVIALGLVLYNATIVDRRPPSVVGVSLSATAGSATVAETYAAIDIELSEPVRQSSVERRFRIDPPIPGTLSWNETTLIFTPSQGLPTKTRFTVTVDKGFEDLAGNMAPAGLDPWAFETVGRPLVLNTAPATGADKVPVDTPLAITFDRLMDPTTVERAIEIQPAAQFHASWAGATVTLTWETPLQFGATYQVTIDPTATAEDGAKLVDAFTTRFTTVTASLGSGTTVPSDGVAGISVRTPIAVVFDGQIDPGSVGSALDITPSVQGATDVVTVPTDTNPAPPVGSAESPSPSTTGGTMLVFQPSGPLAPHTTYTVTLKPVVTRAGSPGQVAPGKTWSFTTGQPTRSGQNQIAFLSAHGGIRNVWLMNPDGSNPRQLTDELAPVAGFDVAGDGARIAWSAGGQIHLMQIDGGGEQTLTTGGQFEYAPFFTADGKSLIVGRRDATGADQGYWLVPLGGGDERQILPTGAPPLGSSDLAGDGVSTGEGSPVWAPRAAFDAVGRRVMLTTGSGDVWLVDLDAASPATGATDTGLVASDAPVWAPTSGRFFVVGRHASDGADALWSISLEGSTIKRADADGSVAVAADGSIAVLIRDTSAATHIAVGRIAGLPTIRSLTSAIDLWDRWPAFAPDGKTVLFARVPAANRDVSAGIWTADVSSGRVTALTTDGAFPRWLP
jgi:hypothetical protein